MNYKNYYYTDLKHLINYVVPRGIQKVELKEKHGQLIKPKNKKCDYLILNNVLGDIKDIQKELNILKEYTHENSKLLLIYYNHLWEPILKFASFMGWRKDVGEQSWLDNSDIKNFLELAGYQIITQQKRLIFPLYIPIISSFLNNYVSQLPIINALCLTTWTIAKPKPKKIRDYTVSIIVPTRNEEGNVPNIIPKIPKFGKSLEYIFVEGHSKDNTWNAIQKEIKKKYPRHISIKAFKQKGVGKGDAVRLGFKHAKGDVLIIYDADMTVSPEDLLKFYDAMSSGKGEFINGSRLVYPMDKEAMRFLNIIGNSIFGWLFTWILGQRFKDTLCGTKVLFNKDYQKISKGRNYFGDFDPFGDFDLIFGAVKQNFKVVEIPVRYKERVYGSTNISRFKHGLLLFKMTLIGFMKFKVIPHNG